MTVSLSEYNKISLYFSDKTGKHCEFVQDSVTMFLKVEGRIYTTQRNNSLSVEEIIKIFDRKIES